MLAKPVKKDVQTPKKRKLMWDWTKGCSSKENQPVPEKKNKIMGSNTKKSDKHVCLQCMELHLKGKRDERFISVCRKDPSSIKRHKDRWHNLPANKPCTFVPSTAPEVAILAEKYAKIKERKDDTVNKSHLRCPTKLLLSTQPVSIDDEDLSENQWISREIQDSKKTNEGNDHSNSSKPKVNPSDPLDDDLLQDSHSEKSDLSAKNQKTLLEFAKLGTAASKKVTCLEKLVDAVSEMSLKVDNIEMKHTTLLQLAFEDNEARESVSAMRKAENIVELTESTQLLEWYYDEATECAVLRCLPCFRLQLAAKPTLAKLTPLKAQHLLNPKSNGTFSSGIFVKKEITRLLIKGKNQTWYRQKNLCIDHLCLIGGGSITHKKAMVEYKKQLQENQRVTTAAGNIFRAAIVDLKLGAAGRQFETLISFLACCAVDVGSIGHSRNNFNDILYCMEKTVDKRINVWLNAPLPSTLLPPHFWATVDKATPSRITNQAVVIVARDKSGVPCPIPVDAPPVYSDFTATTYDDLAKQLLKAISDHFSSEVLSRLSGVAADGPYQASGFAAQLRESLAIENDNKELAMPVTWDTAHVLNLAVTDVRDAKTASGSHFRLFVKRCNVFNHVLTNGKGFAFLQMVDVSARRPVSYATQRFASSSYEQWVKIEKSYAALWKAFDLLHPRRTEEEEWQYMIAGSDFVADLLGFLDIMEPVIDLMLRAQALNTPIWKLKLWWPTVKAKLIKAGRGEPEAFPMLQKVQSILKPDGSFKGVTLLKGWLIVKDDGPDAGENRFTWKMREQRDIKEDRERLARDLADAFDRRINSVVNETVISQLEVFDAASLVKLHCGKVVEGCVKFFVPDGEIEEYGVNECKRILMVASKMPHIQSAGVNFDFRMAHTYMALVKKAVMQGIWNRICPEWFEVVNNNEILNKDGVDLVELRSVESPGLDSYFSMFFSDGNVQQVRLQEQRVYQSFYSNKEIYDIAKLPSCALLDIVLAKGGPEAIAESFYNSMRHQQQSGGQLNETLARRTKINWCLPSLMHCDEIIKEGVALYLSGDDVIRPHRKNAFFSGRAKEYFVSKVVDRIHADCGRCPFLANK